MRRLFAGLLAFVAVTSTLLVLPVYAAPQPGAEPVQTSVEEVPLGSVEDPAPEADVQEGTTEPVSGVPDTASVLTVTRESTDEFSLVGVTWAPDPAVVDVAVQVRVRSGDEPWGEWAQVGPEDAGQDAGQPAVGNGEPRRAGTAPLWTGPSTGVEVELVTRSGAAPTDVRLDLVDPGESAADAALETPDIQDTADAALAMPPVYSRAQWGADESIRTWAPQYAPTIKAATLHHTADANGYTVDQVPAMMRSIYRYHTVSLGWGDIGYNVVADRFGRLWEGRSGGLASTVVGAHAGGFNSGTFGVSMLGNYDTVATTQPMVDAVAAIIAWKFSLYGVDPDGTTTLISGGGGTARYASGTPVTLPTVFGHRDVGSTACPGRYGYARLPEIRAKVARTLSTSVDPGTAIGSRYLADASVRVALGAPTGPEQDGGGYRWQPFDRGRMYSSAETGTHFLVNGNLAAYLGAGGPPVLGLPTTDELVVPGGGGVYNHFPHASIYWSPATGSQVVVNAIRALWIRSGWEAGRLGYPTSGEIGLPGGRGVVQHFEGGDVYWSLDTPSTAVVGGMKVSYDRLGGQQSRLGYPLSGEEHLAVTGGFRQRFQGGDVYWTERTGGQVVAGGIALAYQRLGADAGRLAYPVAGEEYLGDDRGFRQRFQRGAVYWTAATGGMQVTGGIGGLYTAMGAQASRLGYPLTDERGLADGRGIVQSFEGGVVYWSARTGPHYVAGGIGALYRDLGAEKSRLGYPTSDETAVPGGFVSTFEHGRITWTPAEGSRVWYG
ncbi:N-acetylmuramoyl-L-alanine amidase [Geodermatophilus sp. SYSU D00700]